MVEQSSGDEMGLEGSELVCEGLKRNRRPAQSEGQLWAGSKMRGWMNVDPLLE
jgi:hypothetical protein